MGNPHKNRVTLCAACNAELARCRQPVGKSRIATQLLTCAVCSNKLAPTNWSRHHYIYRIHGRDPAQLSLFAEERAPSSSSHVDARTRFLAACFTVLRLAQSQQQSRIETPPCMRLYRFAQFVFPRRFYERFLTPCLADTHKDYFDALQEGEPRKAKWVRIRGVILFWWTVFKQLPLVRTLWSISGC